MTTSASSPLRALAVKSAAWYGATRLWGQVLSWGVTIVLARLLAPHDYGLFAIALSVLALLELLQEFGLGTALVQRQSLAREQVNAVFWLLAGASLLLTAATFLAADAISAFYGEPRLTWVLRILCLTFLVNSLGTVPYSLLTKAINLRRRSLAEAFGTTASALVALWLAQLGYGVWALVLGQLVRSVVLTGAMTCFAGWTPGLVADFRGIRHLLTFGLSMTGVHFVSTASQAASTFILARVLSSSAVGVYAMAQSLTEAPNRLSTAIINQVSFPLFSRVQEDRALLTASFLRISKYLVVISFPVQIGLALVAPDLIPLLLSAKWDGLILPFQILCLESVVVLSTLASSPLLTAVGRANLLFRRSVLSLVCLVGATLVGVPFGLVGVCIARLIMTIPMRLAVLFPVFWELRLSPGAYARSLASPAGATALMTVAVVLLRQAWPVQESRLEILALSVLVGALTYLVALFLLDRSLTGEVRTMVKDLISPAQA
ncbi:MAG: lipopolysaccharide biosynthesis protein [Candidatus Rokuibacteriota bacterium]